MKKINEKLASKSVSKKSMLFITIAMVFHGAQAMGQQQSNEVVNQSACEQTRSEFYRQVRPQINNFLRENLRSDFQENRNHISDMINRLRILAADVPSRDYSQHELTVLRSRNLQLFRKIRARDALRIMDGTIDAGRTNSSFQYALDDVFGQNTFNNTCNLDESRNHSSSAGYCNNMFEILMPFGSAPIVTTQSGQELSENNFVYRDHGIRRVGVAFASRFTISVTGSIYRSPINSITYCHDRPESLSNRGTWNFRGMTGQFNYSTPSGTRSISAGSPLNSELERLRQMRTFRVCTTYDPVNQEFADRWFIFNSNFGSHEYIDVDFADANNRPYSSVDQFVESATSQFEECRTRADGGNGGGGGGGIAPAIDDVGDGGNGGGGSGGIADPAAVAKPGDAAAAE